MKGKGVVKENEVDSKTSRFSVSEDSTLIYSDGEIESCTVVPKGTFVLFEKIGYYHDLGVDLSRVSSSCINERRKISSV